MPRLGRLKRGLGGLAVTKLADQDHVRILAQGTPQSLVKGVGVDTDFTLIDDARRIGVQNLDRILDRDDVLPTVRLI